MCQSWTIHKILVSFTDFFPSSSRQHPHDQHNTIASSSTISLTLESDMSSRSATPHRISLDDLVTATIEMNLEQEALDGHRGPAFQQLKKHMRDLHSDLDPETFLNFYAALLNIDIDVWPCNNRIIECDMLQGGIHPEEPQPLSFTVINFLDAGWNMEIEAFAGQVHGKEFPAGDYPRHTRFRLMVDELLSKKYVPYDWFWEETYPDYTQQTSPWNGARDAELYVVFVDRLIGLFPEPSYNDHSPVSRYTNNSPVHHESPPNEPIPSHDYAVQLLEIGKGLEQEMQENGCDDAIPNYMPHPAFTAFFAIWEKVYLAALDPISLIAVELGQASTLEWVALKTTWRVCGQFQKYGPPHAALTPLPSPPMEMELDNDPPHATSELSPLP